MMKKCMLFAGFVVFMLDYGCAAVGDSLPDVVRPDTGDTDGSGIGLAGEFWRVG